MAHTGDVLSPGTRLDELEIERVAGRPGGFGVTYLARDLGLDVWRAVKEYLPRDWATRREDGTVGPRTGGDEEDYHWGLERFLDEARILARFSHPHIVHVYRVFEAWGTAYMVMEYVEGRTLTEEVKAAGPLPEARVREILLALTEGLSAVHAAGLLHRDIKPDNVMLRPDGMPVLVDFGAARQAIGRHSRSVTAVLTPGYAPIEQYSARGDQGPWTDVYALGAVAFWALSGETPVEATERVVEDGLESATRVGASGGLAAAVDAALAVDKRDRPQSLAAWRALLERPGARPLEPGPSGLESGLARTTSRPRSRPARTALRLPSWLAGASKPGLWLAGASKPGLWLAGASKPGLWLAGAPAVGLAVAALTAPWDGARTEREPTPVASASPVAAAPTARRAVTPERVPGSRRPRPARDVVALDPEEPAAAGPSPAEVEESSLGLGRSARRLIQRGLAAFGFDPGGVDGVFGARTRSALSRWQASRGAPVTGYLDAAGARALRRAGQEAALAAAEAEARRVEAEARRAAAEARRRAEARRQVEARRRVVLVLNRPAAGVLSGGRRPGTWAFNGRAGQRVAVEASSGDFDTTLDLLSPTGARVGYDNNGGPGVNSRLVLRLPASGRYQLNVAPTGSAGRGRYSIAVRQTRAIVHLSGRSDNIWGFASRCSSVRVMRNRGDADFSVRFGAHSSDGATVYGAGDNPRPLRSLGGTRLWRNLQDDVCEYLVRIH